MNIGKLGLSEGKLKFVRVVPKYGDFVVEIVNEAAKNPKEKESRKRLMSLDLGIDNLATITTNTGRNPELVKGKHVKYVNQYYNKQRAHFLGILRHGKEINQGPFTSKKLERMHQKRHRKIKDVFHKVSKYIADAAEEEGIDTIVIGLNKDWKQNADLGKRNNQSFISIPHSMLINMIQYKASEYGIKVIKTEESYTSKSSFLDDDVIPTYQKGKKHTFSGKRVKRGLYRSNKGFLINADVNGSANILKKYYTKTFIENFDVKTIDVWEPKTIFV
jgi:putative transposase